MEEKKSKHIHVETMHGLSACATLPFLAHGCFSMADPNALFLLFLLILAYVFGIAIAYVLYRRYDRTRKQKEEESAQELQNEIEKRIQVEDQVRATEERYQNIFDAATDALFVHDIETGVVVDANKKALELFGFKEVNELNTQVIWLDSPYAYEDALRHIKRAAEEGETTFEWVSRGKEDNLIFADVTLRKISIAGKDYILALRHDITERKQHEQGRAKLETRVREMQKLESLGVMAGGIAHDFNNLLMGVVGNANLLFDYVKPTSPGYDCLKELEASANKAAELTAQLLEYSGHSFSMTKKLDVTTLLSSMRSLMLSSINTNKIEVNFELYDGELDIEGDPNQLRQVIMNLFANAAEAITAETGCITIRSGKQIYDANELARASVNNRLSSGSYVYLEFEDNGIGISPDIQPVIFDPFFSTKFTGRGLGLAVVFGVVRGHDGALFMQSELGKGTTMRLLFPEVNKALVTEQDSDRQEDSTAVITTSARILIVDDEAIVCRISRQMLEKLGYDVSVAMTGKDAIKIFGERMEQNAAYDMVLLDMGMPDIDGPEIHRQMKVLRPEIKIIMASGYGRHEVVSQFADQKIDAFIQKPFEFEELIEIIDQLNQRSG